MCHKSMLASQLCITTTQTCLHDVDALCICTLMICACIYVCWVVCVSMYTNGWDFGCPDHHARHGTAPLAPPPTHTHTLEIASTGSWRLVVPSQPSALLGRHIRLAAASDLLCFLCVFAVLNKTWKRLLECLMRLESAVQTKLPAAGCIILRRETWLHCKSMASWWSKCI